MSETWKDSARQTTRRITLDVIANGDGTFEIVLNQKLVGSRIPERWLGDELCAKYGFCGAEFEHIMRQLEDCGRAHVAL